VIPSGNKTNIQDKQVDDSEYDGCSWYINETRIADFSCHEEAVHVLSKQPDVVRIEHGDRTLYIPSKDIEIK
jgi:hypothetical protein